MLGLDRQRIDQDVFGPGIIEQVLVQLWANIGRKPTLPVFCRPNEMNEQPGVCMQHRAPPETVETVSICELCVSTSLKPGVVLFS